MRESVYCSKETLFSLIKGLWLSLVVAYIALLPSFYLIYKASNRMTLMWSLRYYASIITAIFMLGFIIFVGYGVLQWGLARICRYGRSVAEYIGVWFALFVALRSVVSIFDRAGLLAGAPWSSLHETPVKLVYYSFPPVLLLVLASRERAVRWVKAGYLAISPALVLLIFSPLYFSSYEGGSNTANPIGREPISEKGSTSSNVYIFLLDEWDYEYTFDHPDMQNRLSNLAELLSNSVCFSQAYSPGPTTLTSIPRFLFQCDQEFMTYSYAQVQNVIQQGDLDTYSSIFERVGPQTYTAALGLWHHYPELVGRSTDYAATIHNEAAWRTYWSEVVLLLFSQLGWTRHLGLQLTTDPIPPCVVWIYSLEEIHRQALEIIQQVHQPTFAFFHYCIPHYPYIWDGTGKREVNYQEIDRHTVSNYLSNLMYADLLIGDILESLKQAKKYDDSMLIFTSDHAWRFNPRVPGFDEVEEDAKPLSHWKHVPLVIKYPGQHISRIETNVFYTADLYKLIMPEIEAKDRVPDV